MPAKSYVWGKASRNGGAKLAGGKKSSGSKPAKAGARKPKKLKTGY
jgi:hypothetical protein|tara:strand:+ start:653 stop:790 length:138 start_codon:yes stop_codon:yes gene_type:complete